MGVLIAAIIVMLLAIIIGIGMIMYAANQDGVTFIHLSLISGLNIASLIMIGIVFWHIISKG